MVTRGAAGFRKDGIDKVHYVHERAEPHALGKYVAGVVRKYSDEDLDRAYYRIQMVEEEEPAGDDDLVRYKPFAVSSGQGKNADRIWYWTLFGAQGKLGLYVDGLAHMVESSWFLHDSLFCEWAYIINLDDLVLEVYKGFNKDPARAGRYAGRCIYSEEDRASMGIDRYYGVRLVDIVALDWIRQFRIWYPGMKKPQKAISEL